MSLVYEKCSINKFDHFKSKTSVGAGPPTESDIINLRKKLRLEALCETLAYVVHFSACL